MEAGGRVDQEKAAGKRLAWTPQPILGGRQVLVRQAQDDCREYRATQGKIEKEEKEQEMTRERKDIPNSHTVSQLGSAGPSVNEAGEPKRYVAHP